MRFWIEGAWKENGRAVVKSVEAPSEEDARALAAKEGILVASIKPASEPNDQPVGKMGSADLASGEPPGRSDESFDLTIRSESASLRVAGTIIGALAWVVLILSLIGGGVAASGFRDAQAIAAFLIFFVPGLVACAILQGFARGLMMLAMIGLMVRAISKRPKDAKIL